MANPIEPSDEQIESCVSWGWEYLEDGIFLKGDIVGYYTLDGFEKVRDEDFK